MGNTISNATTLSYGETTCSNPTSTIASSFTEHPPSCYSVKIENLAQLNNEKYQSRRFTVGGYYWKLIIYPKGNDEDHGSGYISMYVEIDSTSEVFAYVKFFVYNKKEQMYFTIQSYTEVKRFNALRMVWGFSQMLPLHLFENPKNGYIFDGQKCEFGVEVMVVPPLTNWEVMSFDQKLSPSTFSWSANGFSLLTENLYVSNNFSVGGREWCLKMYPKGREADGKWLSLFLHIYS
ncbi:putative ubiquitinyl hydrolase 1 [Arabidopsis thaliana]